MKVYLEETLLWWLTVSALVSCSLFGSGCEDNNDTTELNRPNTAATLRISPAAAYISPTNTVAVFSADGGTPPYSWRVSDKDIGTINDTAEDTVTYTRATGVQGANLVILRDQNNWEVQAVITQE